jgi:hypothetical protein
MRTNNEDFNLKTSQEVETPTGGSNFLVSTILHMRRQKRDLQREIAALNDRIRILEGQNAAFLNLSADRLIRS